MSFINEKLVYLHKYLASLYYSFEFRSSCAQLNIQLKFLTFREFILEMLRRSDALEAAVDHDGESRAERLALLHAVRGEHEGAAGAARGPHGAPHLPLGGRVHARRRLVHEHEPRAPQQRHRRAQLALVPSRVLLHLCVETDIHYPRKSSAINTFS